MIYLTKPYVGKEELLAIEEVFKSGWLAGQGPKSKDLSEAIKEFIGCKYAVPVNNATAGLHLALIAIGVKAGDEVIVSDFTFPATGHSVMYCNAIPRFVDVDLKTYNICPELIEEKINKKTKAIIVVHAFGQMAEMEKIMKIAKKHKLKVIEDAACAFGSKYKGKYAGTYGDIGVYSFHARKNITSGEGGAIVTNNKKYADLMQALTCFGMVSAFDRQNNFSIPTFKHLGYNYKLSDVNAGLFLAQLKKYPQILEKKKKIVAMYKKLFENSPYVSVPVEQEKGVHVYQTFAIFLYKRLDRNELITNLKEDDIQSQIGTYCSYIQPVYKTSDKCPNSFRLYKQLLAIPLYYEMEAKDAELVAERLLFHINKQIAKWR